MKSAMPTFSSAGNDYVCASLDSSSTQRCCDETPVGSTGAACRPLRRTQVSSFAAWPSMRAARGGDSALALETSEPTAELLPMEPQFLYFTPSAVN